MIVETICLHQQAVVLRMRGGGGKPEFTYTPVKMHVNNMDIEFPNQLFINGEFVNAISGKTTSTIDPATEKVICEVSHSIHWQISINIYIIFVKKCLFYYFDIFIIYFTKLIGTMCWTC